MNTILYADDQILMTTSEDDLQTMAYHLNLTARKYKMTRSSTKKAMAMWGNHKQRVKIVINDNIAKEFQACIICVNFTCHCFQICIFY